MIKTLIKNAFVVSVDQAVGNIDGTDILIEDGIIRSIALDIDGQDATTIDASGCIAMPGFVDSHRHLWEGGIRNLTAEYSILDFIGDVRRFGAQFFRPEDMYSTSLQGGLEALNAGVTTVADYCHNARTAEHAREGLRGVRDAGLRAVWSFSFTALGSEQGGFASFDERAAFFEAFAQQAFEPAGLVTLGMCPEESSLWRDLSIIRAQFDLGRRFGARISMHANSGLKRDGSHARDVDQLEQMGALGPDLVLVHMGYTTPEEWARLGQAGASVAFTPETELQMGLNWPSISVAREAGVNIGIGVDITANNSGDMFNQLRLGLQTQRARLMTAPGRSFQSRTPLTCADALYWGTLGGAKALGLDSVTGSLTPGKAADIVLLRADDITMVGWDRTNPEGAIIQQAGVTNVETVMVAGRLVKRSGRLVTDPAAACRLLQDTADHVHASARAEGGFGASQEVMYARLGLT